MSSGDKLTIETPEQTALEFPLAGIGSRSLALAIDTLLQAAASDSGRHCRRTAGLRGLFARRSVSNGSTPS